MYSILSPVESPDQTRGRAVAGPILCYHRVGEVAVEGTRHNTPPRQLRSHIRFFYRLNYRFIRAVDFEGDLPVRCVCFTFDDGWLSAIENGLPCFYDLGLDATIYVATDMVGSRSGLAKDDLGEIANWQHLRTVSIRGLEIGNHTARHIPLTRLSKEAALEDVLAAKRALEERNFTKHTFAYPGGLVPVFSREILALAGYPVAVSLRPGPVCSDSDMSALPRLHMSSKDSLPRLIYRTFYQGRVRTLFK